MISSAFSQGMGQKRLIAKNITTSHLRPEQVLAGALESHWNALSDDEDFKREVNLDPSVFRIRSSLFHNHDHHS